MVRVKGIELRQIELPAFGEASVEPMLSAVEYQARVEAVRAQAEADRIDVVAVYGDREHAANLAFLTGFDPRFEEALLLIAEGQRVINVCNAPSPAATAALNIGRIVVEKLSERWK